MLDQKPEDIKIYVHESLLGGGFGGKQDYDEILAVRRHRQMCVHLSSVLDTFYGPEDYVRYP